MDEVEELTTVNEVLNKNLITDFSLHFTPPQVHI